MKKLLLILPVLFLSAITFGQRNISLDVDVVAPADNAVIQIGDQFTMTVVITNSGPDAIMPGDTVAYRDPTGPAVATNFYILSTTASKAVNDTFMITKQLTFNSAATVGPRNFCAYGLVANGAQVNFDTTGWSDCNAITLQGWPTGVNDVLTDNSNSQSLKINTYPNPVVGNTINMDYAAQNSSEVLVNVYDLTGRTVSSKSFGKAFKGQEGYSLDVSDLNSGMYILELRQDGIKATGQFIK